MTSCCGLFFGAYLQQWPFGAGGQLHVLSGSASDWLPSASVFSWTLTLGSAGRDGIGVPVDTLATSWVVMT